MSAPSQPTQHSVSTFQVRLTGPEGSKSFALAEELLVGRGAQAQVVVSHEEVSRRHFKILFRAGRVYVTDEGSRNGTFVDGLRLESGKPQLWSEGQIIRLGLAPHALTLEKVATSSVSTDSRPIHAPEDFQAPFLHSQATDLASALSVPERAPIARRVGRLTPAEGTEVDLDLFEGGSVISSQKEEHADLTSEINSLHLEVADLKLQRQRIKDELEHLSQAREDLNKLLSQELQELETTTQNEIERFLRAAKALVHKAEEEARLAREKARQIKPVEDDPVEKTKTSSGLIAEVESDGTNEDEPIAMVQDIPSAQAWLARIRMPPGARKVYFFIAPLIVLMGFGLLTRGIYLRWAQDYSGQGEWASEAIHVEELQSRVNLAQVPARHRFLKDGQAFLVSELKVKPQVAYAAVKKELDFLAQMPRQRITPEDLLEHRRSMEQMLGSPSAYNKFIGFQSDFLKEKR